MEQVVTLLRLYARGRDVGALASALDTLLEGDVQRRLLTDIRYSCCALDHDVLYCHFLLLLRCPFYLFCKPDSGRKLNAKSCQVFMLLCSFSGRLFIRHTFQCLMAWSPTTLLAPGHVTSGGGHVTYSFHMEGIRESTIAVCLAHLHRDASWRSSLPNLTAAGERYGSLGMHFAQTLTIP